MSDSPKVTLYEVRDWQKHYEHRDTAKTEGPLKWLKVKTATDGLGFRRMMAQPNPHELLAAWHLLLGVAAKQDRAFRGFLVRDGLPLSAADLEIMTGVRADIFARALAFFSEPGGWLCAHVCDFSEMSAIFRATVQDSTVQDRTLHDSKAGAAATDEEWLAALRTNPAYTGLDVDRERAKCATWCENQKPKKAMSRQRFVNWLNRIERPMSGQSGLDKRFKGAW